MNVIRVKREPFFGHPDSRVERRKSKPSGARVSGALRRRDRERDLGFIKRKQRSKPKRVYGKYSALEKVLANRLRTRLNQAIRRNGKAGSAVRDLGCSIQEFKNYLENKFQEGMNWANWNRDGWHIDHIVPLANFDLTDAEQFKQAVHYTNLQPLWSKENLSKGAMQCNFLLEPNVSES